MTMDLQTLQERRRWRHLLPLLAEPGTKVICLDDGARGTILDLTDNNGQLAYRVQVGTERIRIVLATRLDMLPHQRRSQ
jgi:hypothetical protein